MPKQNDLPTPVTANQKFLAKAAGMDVELPTAITMDQMYLQAIAEGSGGGSGDAYTKAETDELLDGKADLENGKVPSSQLPSYVDDVLEYASVSAFPATGESGKIYVATGTNKTYRWSGTGYAEISESLALGETASTAYAGNKGKANADAIAAIKDGTNIDSFADVETALAGKADKSTTYTKDEVDTSQAAQDARILSLEQRVDNRLEHYGMKWEKENSDPQARCTYLYDCANFTPMQCQDDGSVSMGSWANAFFIRNNYPAMVKPDGTIDYLLDPNDHSKKLDGTASHVEDHATDNAMAIFDCHIWIKMAEDETYQYIEVANQKFDDDFVDFPYNRVDGTVNDKLFYPMYEGTIDGNGKLRSLSGSKPQSDLEGGATAEQAAAQLNGTNWQIGDWAHHLWFTLLCMMVGKSTCPELALGEGNTNGGSDATGFCTNGDCNTRGQFYGKPRSATDAENNQPCKAFYVENNQANRWKRTLGFYNINGTYYVKMAPPYTTDETYANYTNCGAAPSADNWSKDLKVNSCGFMTSSVGSPASATTYQGACFFQNNSQKNLLLVGGSCGTGTSCGLWFLLVNDRASSRSWNVGASLYLR